MAWILLLPIAYSLLPIAYSLLPIAYSLLPSAIILAIGSDRKELGVMIQSWMVIGGVAILVALAANIMTPSDRQWFRRLRRPRWLTFEAAIPLIWITIFICGAWSAYIVWETAPDTNKTWLLMGLYLLLEVVTIAYTPVMFRLRSLQVGTLLGGTGLTICIILAIVVLTVSGWATLLLVPYLLWSPIGTYTTWQMIQLNPQDA
ncbi:tryptophan-rich sensory protein [Nostoc sp. PCC 7524]|nr:tryptophan-rich sensory protein [Nostoc sp. PCC 7524]